MDAWELTFNRDRTEQLMPKLGQYAQREIRSLDLLFPAIGQDSGFDNVLDNHLILEVSLVSHMQRTRLTPIGSPLGPLTLALMTSPYAPLPASVKTT